MYLHLRAFLEPFKLFYHIVYLFSFSVMFSWLLYFNPKSFDFSCIILLVYFPVTSFHLLVEFSFVFWNILFCLYYFSLCRYLFNLPSFANTFWFISSSWVFIFSCVAFSFLSLHVPASVLCFIILASFRRFFLIFVFSQISHPGFDFFFVIFEGIPMFSQTDIAPA